MISGATTRPRKRAQPWRLLSRALLALLVLGAWPAQAQPEPAEPGGGYGLEEALKLHDSAQALYAEGKYREAIAQLEEAVRLDPQAKELYYNLGLITEKLGDLETALGYFRKCRELETEEREQRQLERLIKRLEGAQRSQQLRPPPAKPAVSPAPAAPPAGSYGVSPWTYLPVATAGAALAAGCILMVYASSVKPEPDAATGADTTVDDLQSANAAARDAALAADVAFIVSGLAAATALAVAITTAGPRSSAPPPNNSKDKDKTAVLQLSLGPASGQLTWRF